MVWKESCFNNNHHDDVANVFFVISLRFFCFSWCVFFFVISPLFLFCLNMPAVFACTRRGERRAAASEASPAGTSLETSFTIFIPYFFKILFLILAQYGRRLFLLHNPHVPRPQHFSTISLSLVFCATVSECVTLRHVLYGGGPRSGTPPGRTAAPRPTASPPRLASSRTSRLTPPRARCRRR